MTQPNGHRENRNAGLLEPTEEARTVNSVRTSSLPPETLPVATRAKQRARRQVQQNRFVIIAAGAIVAALLTFVAVSLPHRSGPRKPKNPNPTIKNESTPETSGDSDDKSLFPITDSERPPAKEAHPGFVNERDLQRKVVRSGAGVSQTKPTSGVGTLGSIPPFGDKWQAPAYEPGSTADASEVSKTEREAMEKSSFMYVRKVSASAPRGFCFAAAISATSSLTLVAMPRAAQRAR